MELIRLILRHWEQSNWKKQKKFSTGKAFIKGNIDPVFTLLQGSTDQIKKDVEWRINVGKENGGFILSSACSVAPKTPPQNIELLSELVQTFGKY